MPPHTSLWRSILILSSHLCGTTWEPRIFDSSAPFWPHVSQINKILLYLHFNKKKRKRNKYFANSSDFIKQNCDIIASRFPLRILNQSTADNRNSCQLLSWNLLCTGAYKHLTHASTGSMRLPADMLCDIHDSQNMSYFSEHMHVCCWTFTCFQNE
jgi:hypothetical protein